MQLARLIPTSVRRRLNELPPQRKSQRKSSDATSCYSPDFSHRELPSSLRPSPQATPSSGTRTRRCNGSNRLPVCAVVFSNGAKFASLLQLWMRQLHHFKLLNCLTLQV